MQDLQNYVFMPLWLVITLTLLAGVGFEFLIYRVVRIFKRAMVRRGPMFDASTKIVTLRERDKTSERRG